MTDRDQLIRNAAETRDREHRLKPSLRLKTQAEIIAFIHDKGLVSLLGGNELPSLISAVLGRPWKPSAKGFTGWMDWWSLKIDGQRVARVSSEIERREDILASRVFRHSKTFVSNRLWPILGPVVEYHKNLIRQGKILSSLELKLLETIESEGSIRTDRLREKLKLEGRENNSRFHRSLGKLESYALIVGAEDPRPERHLHANIWQTWERRTYNRTKSSDLSHQEALAQLLESSLDTCVVVREDEIRKWYEWSTDTKTAKEELLNRGSIVRVGSYLIASRVLN